MKTIITAILISLCMPSLTFAESNSIDKVSGWLEAYKEGSAKTAVAKWLKGGALEGSKDALSQAGILVEVESYFGEYKDHNVYKKVVVSDRVEFILVVMNYETGPLFGYFKMYKNFRDEWSLTGFKLNTDIDAAFPASFINE